MNITKTYEIEPVIEKILSELKASDDKIEGAINWGDLHVCAVDECNSIYPDIDHFFQVAIEEAEPGSVNLINAIHERIETNLDIRIITEW